jgi:hypothetical protein
MKSNFYSGTIALFIALFSLNSLPATAQESLVSDTVTMAAQYADEIYYSMEFGKAKTGPRNTWDIAFRTTKMSSSILTNDGAGVILYTYPMADTSGWMSIDTNGMSSWTPMYNDPNDWENGSFSRNATGHPDYGWGIYNMVTHKITGDSLFIIKLRDGSLRKLWIEMKDAPENIYQFRYANLDNSGEQQILQDFDDYTAMDFMGFSIETNELVPYQPALDSWDILFTKYMSVQDDGSPYPVTGVLSNQDVKTKNFHPVALDYTNYSPGTWDSTRSSIGWNWKVFDMNTFTYLIVDSSVYFISDRNGHIFKLYFTGFAGSSTGIVTFMKEQMTGMGFGPQDAGTMQCAVNPNPVRERINLYMTGTPGEELTIMLTDLMGRQLRADHPGKLAEGLNVFTVDVTGINPGTYFVTVLTATTRTATKVIITR